MRRAGGANKPLRHRTPHLDRTLQLLWLPSSGSDRKRDIVFLALPPQLFRYQPLSSDPTTQDATTGLASGGNTAKFTTTPCPPANQNMHMLRAADAASPIIFTDVMFCPRYCFFDYLTECHQKTSVIDNAQHAHCFAAQRVAAARMTTKQTHDDHCRQRGISSSWAASRGNCDRSLRFMAS
jgi:hypothetical protein